MLDGELWINTGSPVKQEGENNGRVFEIRDQGKVPSDEFIYGGRIADAEKPDGAPVEAAEEGAQASKFRGQGMSTQVMTKKELVLLLALERMIELADVDDWGFAEGFDDALEDAREAVRIARLET